MPPRHVMLAAIALTALLPLHAQNLKEGSPLYKVEINFRDGNEAGATTDRRYTMLAMDSRRTVFKAGSKNPAVTETAQPQGGNWVRARNLRMSKWASISIVCCRQRARR